MTDFINVKNLTFSYGPDRTLLKNLSFSAQIGRFLAVAGPNGAGKTTLLNLLCRSLKPQTGSITINGRPLSQYSTRQLATKIAVVRQQFIPVFDFKAAEIVAMAQNPYISHFNLKNKPNLNIISHSLQMTDVAQFADKSMTCLSAGERQRVFIARALAQTTPALLLDEPTSFLDFKHQVAIYDLLKRLQLEKNKTIVTITHDINLALQYCDDGLLLGGGGSWRFGPADEVFTRENIEKAFLVPVLAGQVQGRRFFLPVGKSGNKPHKENAGFQQ